MYFQLVYYDVPTPSVMGSMMDSHDGVIDIVMDFNTKFSQLSRLFEIRVTQIPFSQSAPPGCMQYFSGVEGIIQVNYFFAILQNSFNFLENILDF